MRNTAPTSHHRQGEFSQGQKETPCVLPPSRILLAGITVWLSNMWAARKEPEFSVMDRRLIPSPSNLRLWTKRQGSPPGSPDPPALHRGSPFPLQSNAFPAPVSAWTAHFRVGWQPTLGPWKGSPFLKHHQFSTPQVGTSPSSLGLGKKRV